MQVRQTKRVLVADDDPAAIQSIASFFRSTRQTYELLNVSNGDMACQVARNELPDLIILDWEMPAMTGLEVLAYLKNHSETQAIPVIIATGSQTQSKHLEEALETGAVDYLRKPFDRIELLARSQAALRLAEAHQREKQLIQAMVAYKNRELSAFALQVAQKNQVLEEIKQALEKTGTTRQPTEIVLKIIQENQQLDNSWDKFKLHFEEVHPDFFARLRQKSNALSQNEQKLCAYTKMQLSTKEIAQLLNISPKSVEMARYRVKKKLDLVVEQNLHQFIQQI